MLVKIKRQAYDSFDDVSLIWACIEPTIQKIRGKNFIVKSEVTSHLTAGQRALLMFQMLYGHSINGIEEFYIHLSYLLSKKGVWSELKNGILYFGDYLLSNLLGEMEEVYHTLEENNCKIGSEWLDAFIDKDSELQITISRLDNCLYELLPKTIKLIGTYIRCNSDEFIEITD